MINNQIKWLDENLSSSPQKAVLCPFILDILKDLEIMTDYPSIQNEYFTSIRLQNKLTWKHGEHGYIKPNPLLKHIYSKLFQDRPYNQSIEVIEWDNCYLVGFKDGVYISSNYLKASKDEMDIIRGQKQIISVSVSGGVIQSIIGIPDNVIIEVCDYDIEHMEIGDNYLGIDEHGDYYFKGKYTNKD